jgi:hypothetical protein
VFFRVTLVCEARKRSKLRCIDGELESHIPTVVSADFGIFSELGAGHFHRRRAL